MESELEVADGTYSGAVPTKKALQVETELSYLDNQIAETGSLLTDLCQRLTPICRDEHDGVGVSSDEETLCSLASSIRAKRAEVERNNSRLKDLIRRLEL